MSESASPSLSFDRMRSMLVRAAEIRDSEQQQVFDSLDEIHARLAALDALGSMRKRLSEVPDRGEVRVLAERLDEAVVKLGAHDAALAGLSRAVEAVVDGITAKLSAPLAQLDGRLDGVAGRFEGVAGRMDGLEDRLSGLHKRLDDLDNRLDRQELRLDGMPAAVTTPVRERLDGLEAGLREERAAVQAAVAGSATETREGLGERLDGLAERLVALGPRLEEVVARVDRVEDGVGGRVRDLAGVIGQGLDKLDGSLTHRPDNDTVARLVRQANQESERRSAGQLDEAMATFAELILGRGAAQGAPVPAPRPAQRRRRTEATADAEQASGPPD